MDEAGWAETAIAVERVKASDDIREGGIDLRDSGAGGRRGYAAESLRERVTAFARKLAALPTEAAGIAKTAVDIAASVDCGTARDFDATRTPCG